MKKFIGIVLAVMMSFGILGTCFASEIDLKSMSIDELIKLRNEVIAELNEKVNPVGDIIGTGVFMVGTDIKEGFFNLTKISEEFCAIKLYESREKFDEGETILWKNPSQGEMITVVLREGMVLELSGFTATIEELIKPSWAP